MTYKIVKLPEQCQNLGRALWIQSISKFKPAHYRSSKIL